jgi:hypothetical protein
MKGQFQRRQRLTDFKQVGSKKSTCPDNGEIIVTRSTSGAAKRIVCLNKSMRIIACQLFIRINIHGGGPLFISGKMAEKAPHSRLESCLGVQ